MSRAPLKRFYKIAEAGTAPGAATVTHVVRLDGKLLKTPLRETLSLPTQKLAAAVAAEWAEQKTHIIPDDMPLTQLANTLQDKAAGAERPDLNAEVCKYAESDLVCYLATHPPELVRRQEEAWLPLLHWLQEDKGITLTPVRGIRYEEQTLTDLEKVRDYIAAMAADHFTALQAITGVTGSVVIALALTEGYIDSDAAYRAACVDELYQLETWGDDTLARERLERINRELQSAARFIALARD